MIIHDTRLSDYDYLWRQAYHALMVQLFIHFQNPHISSRWSVFAMMGDPLDMKQIFFTNLQLLGLDAAAEGMDNKIPFNK